MPSRLSGALEYFKTHDNREPDKPVNDERKNRTTFILYIPIKRCGNSLEQMLYPVK